MGRIYKITYYKDEARAVQLDKIDFSELTELPRPEDAYPYCMYIHHTPGDGSWYEYVDVGILEEYINNTNITLTTDWLVLYKTLLTHDKRRRVSEYINKL